MKFQDQLNRIRHLHNIPKRIVSLVPSQTELLVDLGLESSIVGVTKFCVHPIYLRKEKAVIGGTKTVNYEKIKSLNPDIILCNKEENTQDMIAELESIAPVHISDVYNLEDALELIDMYGKLFSVKEKAVILIQNIMIEYKGFIKFTKDRPQRIVAYFIWKDPWMVAASQTFIDAMLHLNRFHNTFSHLERYPEVDIDIINKEIDLLLLSSEPYPFKEEHSEELEIKFPNAKIIVVDGEYFSWYGSRLVKAFRYFKTLHLDE